MLGVIYLILLLMATLASTNDEVVATSENDRLSGHLTHVIYHSASSREPLRRSIWLVWTLGAEEK
jgi:hypothetical protein